MKLPAIIILVILCIVPPSVNAQNKEIKLWPSFAPGTEKRDNLEKWDEEKQLYHVYQPGLTVFLPEKGDTCVPAIIVCPGGGFKLLAMEKEGYKIARWLNENGIAAFVLKYRLVPSEALQDAQRAVRVLRAKADAFDIDKNRIGIIGFSAGANLSANLAIDFHKTETHDAIDSISGRPDFWIGVYGVYEPRERAERIHPYFFSIIPLFTLVSQDTPPTFLVHAADDPRAPVLHSVHLYEALKKNGIPAELHIYERGGHGFALEKDRGEAVMSTVLNWSKRCIEWLRVRAILARNFTE